MWYYGLLATAVLASGPLQARECPKGSSEMLSVTKWSAEETEIEFFGTAVALSVTLKSLAEHDLRMIDGRIYFDDVLGRAITNLTIEDDARIAVGSEFEQSGRYRAQGQTDITRLAAAESEDIVVTTCVMAAVTGNGEVLRFDE